VIKFFDKFLVCIFLLPLPQGQGSFLPTLANTTASRQQILPTVLHDHMSHKSFY